jgi:hypothetical protein
VVENRMRWASVGTDGDNVFVVRKARLIVKNWGVVSVL